MAKKKKVIADDDFDDIEDELPEEFNPFRFNDNESIGYIDARRRLEKLKEEKELERLLDSRYDDYY